MIKAEELSKRAREFLNVKTCYLKGFFGQPLTQAEYDRVLKMYPDNAKYNNEAYIGTGAYAFDCICFVKFLVSNGYVNNRISYAQLKASPIGDCTTQDFMKGLTECVEPAKAPAGYGLATAGHAAISLGGGMWIDANKNATQNGIALHTTGIERFTRAGKIKGIDYETPEPIIPAEREILEKFTTWLIEQYLTR